MLDQWPVEGHSFWYKTEISLENGYRLKFDLTLPGTIPTIDLSTVRVGRHGASLMQIEGFASFCIRR
jgi:hypothetical protein